MIHDLESKTDIQVSKDKTVQYDRLRNSYDIRNRDPKTLNTYQLSQLKRYEEIRANNQSSL